MRNVRAGLNLLATLSVLAMLGFPNTARGQTAPGGPPGPTFHFMFGQSLVGPIVAAGISPLLDGTSPYIVLNTTIEMKAPASWRPVYVKRYGTEATLEAELPSLPAAVTVVMYDNEPHASPGTAANELADPPTFFRKAAAAVHASGRRLFATGGGAASFSVEGEVADGFSMQTQMGELNTNSFAARIRRQAAILRDANPRIVLTAGVGDRAKGVAGVVDSPAIEAAIREAEATEPGIAIWLNITTQGGTPFRPDIGVAVLRDMLQH